MNILSILSPLIASLVALFIAYYNNVKFTAYIKEQRAIDKADKIYEYLKSYPKFNDITFTLDDNNNCEKYNLYCVYLFFSLKYILNLYNYNISKVSKIIDIDMLIYKNYKWITINKNAFMNVYGKQLSEFIDERMKLIESRDFGI